MTWSRPRNLRELAVRTLSLRVLVLVLAVFSILLSELRFDWAERLLGAYLVTTNGQRPESGSMWEVGRRARSAHQTLERIATDRIASQREAREAAGFGELARRLQPGQGVMLAADHFRRLYLALPAQPARELISPFHLLAILGRERCERVYVKQSAAGEGLSIFLLDRENRVLETLHLPPRLIATSLDGNVPGEGRLEDFPGFEGRIYPAPRFFEVLATLPDEIRSAVVPQPERLLEMDGPVLRAGIGDEVSGGYIRLGFEVRVAGSPRVVLMQGREWAVWQLRSRLTPPGAAPDGFQPGGGHP